MIVYGICVNITALFHENNKQNSRLCNYDYANIKSCYWNSVITGALGTIFAASFVHLHCHTYVW